MIRVKSRLQIFPCFFPGSTSKENAPAESRTRKTRSGKVFGKESSKVNAARAAQAAESTPAPEISRPKSKSDCGNSKRKKNGHSQGHKKKLRLSFAGSNPLVNWSYEEIQAKLDAIHGTRERSEENDQGESAVSRHENLSPGADGQNKSESTAPEGGLCSKLGRGDSSPANRQGNGVFCDPDEVERHCSNANSPAQLAGSEVARRPRLLQVESGWRDDRIGYSPLDPRKISQPRLAKVGTWRTCANPSL